MKNFGIKRLLRRKHKVTIADMKKKMEGGVQAPRVDFGVYWWVYGNQNGRRVLFGPFTTEDEAEREGYAKLTSNYETVCLKTRDEQQASRILRARVLGETQNLDETFRRFKHKNI